MKIKFVFDLLAPDIPPIM
nr:4.9 kDa non-structural protein [Bovine coronavirus]